MRPLKRLELKFAALALLFLAVALVCLIFQAVVIAPLNAIADETVTLLDVAMKARALVMHEQKRQAQLAQTEPASTQASALLTGPDSGAAIVQLLQVLSSNLQSVASQGASCTLSSRTPGPPQSTSGYVRVEVDVGLECQIEPLGKLIYSLENQRPFVFVEALNIRRLTLQDSDKRLAVQMSISGYTRSDIPASSAP